MPKKDAPLSWCSERGEAGASPQAREETPAASGRARRTLSACFKKQTRLRRKAKKPANAGTQNRSFCDIRLVFFESTSAFVSVIDRKNLFQILVKFKERRDQTIHRI
ncbi:hypothetical protein RsS93_11410 [Rhizobium dioscoreae]|uniref:Uncharacterized protein n=1 Tax=Rhizobium dioscoreae TaxID=2653122 RepID=A0ABQ0YZX4_9HYPH|nr:hypothetical protein RsS93_11410 [Rhizobium dioscoreae]